MHKKEFALSGIDKQSKILEIGPSKFPMYPKRDGYDVEIVDYVAEEELKKIYAGDKETATIEKVDFICSGQYAKNIGKEKNYDVIAASHVIEVVVDFIETLNDFSFLLKDNGVVKLVIPDKRYEYDCFREVTSIRSMLDSHFLLKQNNNTIGCEVDCFLHKTLIDGLGVDFPVYGLLLADAFKHEYEVNECLFLAKEIMKSYKKEEYKHVQTWVFTPKSFELLIYQLNILGLIDLSVESIYTRKNGFEFYVNLKKTKEEFDIKKYDSLLLQRRQEDLEYLKYYEKLLDATKDANKGVYIFGTGKRAKRVTELLDSINISIIGYVVSDGRKEMDVFCERPVFEMLELRKNMDELVVLGVSERFRPEIEDMLEERGLDWV